MGKTPKVKKREVSVRSRAARRNEALQPDLAVKASVVETEYKPWLHTAQEAGISKKKNAKQLSRQQKLRQQKGVEKAEKDQDRLERKVMNSKQRGKKVQARRLDWNELNEKLTGKKEEGSKFQLLALHTPESGERAENGAGLGDDKALEPSVPMVDVVENAEGLTKDTEDDEIDEIT